MSIQNGTGKMLIGIFSAVLMAIGGYSADTITTLVKSNHELSIRISKLESKVDLTERIKRLELRIDGIHDVVHSQIDK
jgi:hypothetical protein